MSKYGMTDSGKRQSFGKGMAIRDTADDKPRPDLISPFAEERQGHWLRMGAAKYAERNWEKGMPFSRCVASLKRHLMKYQQGKRDEDHLAAIMFNAMALIHYEEMIERGVLPRTQRHAELPAEEATWLKPTQAWSILTAISWRRSTWRPPAYRLATTNRFRSPSCRLNSDIRPLEGVRPFYTTIRPEHPERQRRGRATSTASRWRT